ncbi:MAG TPA: asparagine synthase (glutamine-hydrolyzing) [Clostridia bacterium]
MCGLAGWISDKIDLKKQEHILMAMSQTLKKRGPDDFGEVVFEDAALLHRRLCVVDPQTGIQPMTKSKNGETYTIVYNGELYNTSELVAELGTLGYKFVGHSDTEALIYAYIEWGKDCLKRLNGIFAFGVWEHNKKRLFAARDRFGVKPLFYYKYDNSQFGKGLVFGSEIKTLLANPIIPKKIDADGLKQIFLLGPGKISGSGIIKDIYELKPAHYLIYNSNGLEINRYWQLEARPHEDNLFLTIEKTRWLVLDSIKRQLISDVPLGCFLSGGLDSSIISSVASAMYLSKGQRLNTYSVDYKDNELFFERNAYQPDSDHKYIAQMSEFIKSNHNYITLDNKQVGIALKEALIARDVPGMADIDSSLLLFCQVIKEKSTVCLSGECADEIFGGYPWYHNQQTIELNTFPWSKSLELRKKLIKHPAILKDCDQWVQDLYNDTISRTRYLKEDNTQERRMRELFMLNVEWFMQTLLDRKDRMSMESGLEVRVPFCDHRLVEYAYNMPWKYKAYNGREKGILREAVKDILPYDIIKRKKNPYPKTFSPDYLSYVKDEVRRITEEKGNIVNELVDTDFIKIMLDSKTDFDDTFYGQLMRLPQLLGYIVQIDYFFKIYDIEAVI